MISTISINDFLKINHDINLIDIRSVEKYNNNHIPNAINIPYEKIIMKPELYLNKLKIYYIYCQKGITSMRLCSMLKKQGYKVINLSGGYEAWILENN